ncbi:centrosomal protein 43-like isoform X2 [Watersipora subatra]|uniref:centrosomal protein 43-like isoform X2 n=1 Tax=Watersipora subatra TaxID=2589382 RepID=UPI00355BC2DB
MSIEEDTELRDVVLETLDQRGVVGKTKAMLRANIFTALEETAAPHDKIYMLNKRLKENLSSSEGKLMAALIVDYFNCWQLEFSKTVFEPETGYDTKSSSRMDLCNSLGISAPPDQQPVLSELIKKLNEGSGSSPRLSRRQLPGHSAMDLNSKQIADARAKFAEYDKDGSGTIDKDELRQLFIDMFPHFHSSMLERYVNDEFQAADTDFSAGIDMDEFIDLYRRLFISCRSVVSHDIVDLVPTPRSPSPRFSKIPIKSDNPVSGSNHKDGSPRDTHGSQIPKLNIGPSRADSTRSPPSAPGSTDHSKATSNFNNSSSNGLTSEKSGLKGDLEMKSIDKSLADLGFDIPDEDDESIRTKSDTYEDDFEKSNASSMGSHRRSKTADSVSSDETTDKMDDDDINSLLKDNDISWGNETEDKSITDDSSVKGVDYWEMVPRK